MIANNNITNALQNSIGQIEAVTIINQRDVLLKKYIYDDEKDRTRMFNLHETRIFLFSKPGEDIKFSTEVSSPEQSLILTILTTSGFRMLQIMYILFRLLDNCALVTIIVLSIIHGRLHLPTTSQLALFSLIGVDLFYNTMLTVNKYWGLQRISCHIGIILFILYFGILECMRLAHLDSSKYYVCLSVLSFRFVVFLIEEMTDIGIDMCIHNTLLKLLPGEPDNPTHPEPPTQTDYGRPPGSPNIYSSLTTTKNGHIGPSGLNPLNPGRELSDKLKANTLPHDLVYVGSFFAWGAATVKDWKQCINREEFSNRTIILMFLPAFFPSVILGLIILTLLLVAGTLVYIVCNIFTCLCRGMGANQNFQDYFKELMSP